MGGTEPLRSMTGFMSGLNPDHASKGKRNQGDLCKSEESLVSILSLGQPEVLSEILSQKQSSKQMKKYLEKE